MSFCGNSAPVNEQVSCKYEAESAHQTTHAQLYHHQKCMKRVVESMQDKTKCVGYLTAISHNNPDMQGCSIDDLGSICEQYAPKFSVKDAEKLCTNINQAQTEFWKDMYTTRN